MEYEDVAQSFFLKYPSRPFKKGAVVMHSGEPNHSLSFLESGYIRSCFLTDDGFTFTTNILLPGSIYPLTQVLAGMSINPYEFQTLTAVCIRTAPREDVLGFFEDNPRLYAIFAHKFASGIEAVAKRMQHLIKADGSLRVVCAFDLLMKKFGQKNNDGTITIMLPHTHQDIADIAGVSRETASREMQKLKKAGILTNNKQKTRIIRPDRLCGILKEDSDLLGKFGL